MENLDKLRNRINELDEQLINLFAERFEVVRKVGKFKKENNMPLCDRKTQSEVLKIRVKQGEQKKLDKKFTEKLYNLIFDEAIRIEGVC